jgi:SAM-dependent methyltransferase
MAKHLKCYLCGKHKFVKRPGKVRDNPALDILECLSCGLVFLSSFAHIDNEYYSKSLIHEEFFDLESVIKDVSWDDERRFECFKRLIENKSVLDFGCGAGGFLLRARAVAFSVAGVEIEKRMLSYLKRENVPIFDDIADVNGKFDIITLFHALEHMKDPISVLKDVSKKLKKGGTIIVEVPSANDALLKLYENSPYSQFTYWSCHLFLFTDSTLVSAAEAAGLKVNYVKQVQRYPLSNHLHWLAKGKPGGHKIWGFLDSEELNRSYEQQLAALNLCDTIVAGFSKS